MLLIFLTCFNEFLLLRSLKTKQIENMNNYSTLHRKFEYFYQLSKNSESSKDIKLYDFYDYLIKIAADISYQIELNTQYTNQCAATSAMQALLNFVREIVAYTYLVYLVF